MLWFAAAASATGRTSRQGPDDLLTPCAPARHERAGSGRRIRVSVRAVGGLRLRVLGRTSVVVDDHSVPISPRQRSVLAYLAMRRGEVDQASLAEAVGIASRDSLHTTVANLRRRVREAGSNEALVVSNGDRYALADVNVDLADAVALARRGRAMLTAGELGKAAGPLGEAVALLAAGPPFTELDEPEVAAEHLAWEELNLTVAADAAEAAIREGRHADVFGELTRLVAEHPLHEGLVAWLAVAMALAHRQADALHELAELRRRLREQLGQPLGDLASRAELAILRQDLASMGCASTSRPVGVPPGLRALAGAPFVGRAQELDRLSALCASPPRLVVVSGPPGAGKTSLVACFAGTADDGSALAFAWCDEQQPGAGAVPVLWLEQLLGGPVDDPGGASAALRLAERLRHELRLHQRTVLVIDDAQWLDPVSASALNGLLMTADARFTVVATARTGSTPRPWRWLLAECQRRGQLVALPLGPLSVDDVLALVTLLRPDLSPGQRRRVARDVHERGSGNAFAVRHLIAPVDHAGRGGDADAVTAQLVGALDDAVLELLRVMAVLGPSCMVTLLAAVAGMDADDVVSRLEPAMRAGVVVEVEPAGTIRFAHELFRTGLLVDVSAERRRRCHARAAAFLLGDDERSTVLRTWHRCRAVPVVPPDVARAEAAAVASKRLAVGDVDAAAKLYELAHELSATIPGVGPAERGRLLLGWGRALDQLGDAERADAILQAAHDEATAAGEGALLAEVALAGAARGIRVGVDATRRSRLSGALHAVGDEHPELRTLLIAELAINTAPDDPDLAHRLSVEARRRARRLGPGPHRPAARATLARRAAIADSPDRRLRLAASSTAAATASACDDIDTLVIAASYRTTDLLQAGRLAEAVASAADEDRLAECRPTPKERWFALARRVCFAQLAGRFVVAEAATAAALEVGTELGYVEAVSGWSLHLFTTALLRDGVADLAELIEPVVLASPDMPAWAAGHALALAQRGDERAGTAVRSAASSLASAAGSPYAASGWCVLADACTLVGDTDVASVIEAHLAPHSGLLSVVGTTVASFGPVDRYLSGLRRLLGDEEGSASLTAGAIELARRVSSPPWELWCEVDALPHDAGEDELATLRDRAVALGLPVLVRRLDVKEAIA